MINPSTTMSWFRAKALAMSLVLAAMWAGRCPAAAGPQGGVAPEQQQRLELMKSKGPDGSLTILPVRLAGQPFDRVTEVVGVLLEKQGLRNIELGKTPCAPAAANLESLAAAVGAFVKTNPITTGHALYAEYNGGRQTGLNELRAVVVDQAGAVVWTDRQTPQDKAFQKNDAREPMTMSVLLVERLSPQLGLNEATAKAAKPGKLAALLDERSGLPPGEERAALPQRQQLLKESKGKATLLIFPARVHGREADAASAASLAKMINEAGLCKASAANQSLLLKASQADPNELKSLWDLAREFRDYARKNPPDADYVLYPDYAFNPQNWEQGFVHFVVCDRQGEWVIADMQNSHHPDYQAIQPASREGCDKLLVKRLEGYWR